MKSDGEQRSATDDIHELRQHQLALTASVSRRNVITYYSSWLNKRGLDNSYLAIDDLDMRGFMSVIDGMDPAIGVDLILHTPGGNLAATEAIINYLRSVFPHMRAIVPQLAMSGGTMIACACDEIVMGNHSSLGPTDPFVSNLSAHGILREFDRARNEIRSNANHALLWRPILEKYYPDLVGACENAVAWSETLVEESLRARMFRDLPDADVVSRKVASALSYQGAAVSHSQHLHIDKCRELGLRVSQLENDPGLRSVILPLHDAYLSTFASAPETKLIENHLGVRYYILAPSP